MKHILRKTTSHIRLVVCAALLFCATQAASAAPVTFNVQVNTTSINGTAGFINLQFNPGNTTSPAATAVVSNFMRTGGALGSATATGSVAGMLPGTVSFTNSTQFNDLFQEFTFGNSFNFDVTLNVTGTGGNFASDFLLFLFANDGMTPLLSTDADGRLLAIQLNANSSTLVQTFGSPAGVITVRQVTAPVPEPATMLLLGTGLAGIAVAVRRRKKA